MKKILALLLVAAMCLALLAACASTSNAPANDNNAEPNTNTTTNETPAENTEPDASDETDTSDTDDEEDDEPLFEDVEINVLIAKDSGAGDAEAHEAAVSALVEEKIGVKVNLTVLPIGEYATQISLAISGGEVVDLAALTPIPGANFAAMTGNGQAMPLNDLLENYGQGIIAEAGDYLSAGSINGNIYSVPVLRQKGSNLHFGYNTEVAESLGIVDAINAAETFADLEPIFQAVIDNMDTMYAVGGNRYLNGFSNFIWNDGSFSDITGFDTLGDQLNSVYLDENGNAALLINNEAYVNEMKMFADWAAKGFVWPDTLTNNELTAAQLEGNGLIFCDFKATELGGEATASQQAGIPISLKEISKGMVTTTNFVMFSTFVPVTAEEPEAAIAFLNLLYTDPEVMNTMAWGVEGENYVVKDGVAYCPEGTDISSCGWHMPDFFIGNSFLLIPWDGTPANFRELARADLATAPTSAALGFSLNTSAMSDLIGAVNSVHEEYWYALMSGLYTDKLMEDYRSAMAAAGADRYVAEIQAQLDAWRNA